MSSTDGMIMGNLINGYYASGTSSAAILIGNSIAVFNPDWTILRNTLIASPWHGCLLKVH